MGDNEYAIESTWEPPKEAHSYEVYGVVGLLDGVRGRMTCTKKGKMKDSSHVDMTI